MRERDGRGSWQLSMSEELEILKIVTERLSQGHFEYMISGSMAANYYTIPRMTRDIDIVIELSNFNLTQFVGLFKKDFFIDEDLIREEVPRKGMFNIIHRDYAIKIDFILHKGTEFQASSFERKRDVRIGDISISIITPEDLILAKMLWAKDSYSDLQLNDIRNIMKTVENLDQKYINAWVEKLDLQPVYEKARA